MKKYLVLLLVLTSNAFAMTEERKEEILRDAELVYCEGGRCINLTTGESMGEGPAGYTLVFPEGTYTDEEIKEVSKLLKRD